MISSSYATFGANTVNARGGQRDRHTRRYRYKKLTDLHARQYKIVLEGMIRIAADLICRLDPREVDTPHFWAARNEESPEMGIHRGLRIRLLRRDLSGLLGLLAGLRRAAIVGSYSVVVRRVWRGLHDGLVGSKGVRASGV